MTTVSRRILSIVVTAIGAVLLLAMALMSEGTRSSAGAAFTTATPTNTPTPTPTPTVPTNVCGDLVFDASNPPTIDEGDTVEITVNFEGCELGYGLDLWSLSGDGVTVSEPLTPLLGGTRTFLVTGESAGLTELRARINFETIFFRPDGGQFFNFTSRQTFTTLQVLSTNTEAAENLAAAQARWAEADIDAYRWDYRRVCFCLRVPNVSAWVYRGDVIKSLADDNEPTGEFLEYTVEDIFGIIEDAIAGNAARIDVEYADDGHPVNVYIDYSAMIADEEFSFQQQNFDANNSLARELYKVSVAEGDGPGDEYSLTYTWRCTFSAVCEVGETTTQVDIRSGMVTGSNPEVSIYPIHTFASMISEWQNALDVAAQGVVDGVYVVEAEATYGAELLFPRSYALTVSFYDERRVAEVLELNLDAIGPYGCCSEINPPVVPVVIYEESFEGPTDWTVDNSGARTGDFGVSSPEGTTSRDGITLQPEEASDGVRAMVTDGRAGFRAGSYDVDGGTVVARSGPIVLPDGDNTLSMDWYFGHASRRDATDAIEVTVASSTSSRRVLIADGSFDSHAEWKNLTADLSSFSGSTIQITVEVSDNRIGGLVEGGVDNIVITNAGATDVTVLWSEDFESGDTGWTFGTNGATTGLWNVGDPQGTQWRNFTLQQEYASEGAAALVTDGRAGSDVGSYDVDNGAVVAVSDVIQIPVNVLPTTTTLEFDWYLAHLYNTSDADFLRVEVLAGDQVLNVLEVEGVPSFRPNDWDSHAFDLTALQGAEIRLRISAADGGFGSLIEAGVDNIRITSENVPFPEPR